MTPELAAEIHRLELRLWNEHRCLLCLPARVPPEVRLAILQELCRPGNPDLPIPPDDIDVDAPRWMTHIDMCDGWCPTCPILIWCEHATESFTPEEIEWMIRHHDYPPEV